jgi:4-amino-4-deoxy-L-arabinose transferase-like glycosyltransferase
VFALALLPAPDSVPSTTRSSVAGGPSRLPEAELVAARRLSAVFGALAVLVASLLSPLAGFFLAIHTTTIKYTSLVMLEALPAFTSLAAVACWVRSKREGSPGWRIASAALLGLTAAGKYMYAVVGVAILIDWAVELRSSPASRREAVRSLALWGGTALIVFFAADPYLWPDPLWRLRESVTFHAEYAASTDVTTAGFPFWQPLAWLVPRIPAGAPAALPFLVRLDPLIALLALVGLDRLWRRQRVSALWLGVALLFLLLWNTKWPHYVLILTAPLCLAAAEGVERLLALPLRTWRAWRTA